LNQIPPQETNVIRIPHFSLVVLVGVAGSGKSTFAKQNFKPTEILSADHCRAMISDDEADQTCSAESFELLRTWGSKRLSYGRLTVIDATNTTTEARQPFLKMAEKSGAASIAIVLDFDAEVALAQNNKRARRVPEAVICRQFQELRTELPGLWHQGFAQIHRLTSPMALESLVVRRMPSRPDKRRLQGPFDVIGDIHGCFDELVELIEKLGYRLSFTGPSLREAIAFRVHHPEARTLLFLGDLCDRGPMNHQVLRLVMDLVDQGKALSLLGNHEAKLRRYLEGKPLQPTHGLAQTIANLEGESTAFQSRILRFFERCWPHLVLDNGDLVISHGGLPESLHGYEGGKAMRHALYGDVKQGNDAYGLPIRADWAADYQGNAKVLYGHTPVEDAVWRFGTMCLDTGCVFGGRLTALRYPEDQLVDVKAKRTYFEPVKPLGNFTVTHP